ncbi:hypothetical protein GMD78_13080 [Ornithinibacillus sp. L9]|uniref:Uncharacterized protein n=1 Tax=Ornithinibacillus caprae TaxID=2678566 RepID=A0A6N8FIL3_9BACI|nr:hypothetical protein [Ornithinibacillus caprae]MUK89305.1 hypothetical protein [Ornithinibacillus caprae]
MYRALEESQWLYEHVLNEYQKQVVSETITEIDNKEKKYSLDAFWKVDEEIGGLGGYNLPKHPANNPFPYGIKRSIFRPLQYASSEMDIRDIRYGSRYVVQYAGMHLEATTRFYLIVNQKLRKLRNFNSTLGKVVHQLGQMQLLDKKTIESLYVFIKLFNKSKHEVNQDRARQRLFTVSDALVVYLTVRILGNRILQEIDPGELESTVEL